METIDYLGLLVQSARLELAAHTADVIQKIEQPRHTTKFHSF